MQSKSSESLSDEIIELLSAHFGEKVGSFSVYNMMDTPHIEFNITFDLYNFFLLLLLPTIGADLVAIFHKANMD